MQSIDKVLIIGLDGVTWKIIDPLINEGYMPNLKKIVECGSRGILKSTIPPISPVAWSSFQTGVNPVKHVIFNFKHLIWENSLPKGQLVDSSCIFANTLWDYLGSLGKKSIVINVPMTYPPRRINGIMISGMLTPSLLSVYTYPKQIKQELLKHIPNYGPPKSILKERVPKGSIDNFIQNLKEMVEIRLAAGVYLIQKYPWDVFMLQFQVTDFLQHPLWYCLDREYPGFSEQCFEKVVTIYQAIDRAISDLIAKITENCLVFIVSDHGFQGCEKRFNMNAFLTKKGLLFPRYNIINSVVRLLKRSGFSKLRQSLKGNIIVDSISSKSFVVKYDWSRSLAYANCCNYAGIHLLESEDSFNLEKEKIINLLNELKKSPRYGRIIDDVFETKKIYKGSCETGRPDLIVSPYKGVLLIGNDTGEGEVITEVKLGKEYKVGIHDSNGIFVVYGSGIRERVSRLKADLVDIFPTILYTLGLPIPKYIDGKVMQDIFLESPQLEQDDYVEVGIRKFRERLEAMTSKEQAKVEERLRDLGYFN